MSNLLTKKALKNIDNGDDFIISPTCDRSYVDKTTSPPSHGEIMEKGSIWKVKKKWNAILGAYEITQSVENGGHWCFPLFIYDNSFRGFNVETSVPTAH